MKATYLPDREAFVKLGFKSSTSGGQWSWKHPDGWHLDYVTLSHGRFALLRDAGSKVETLLVGCSPTKLDFWHKLLDAGYLKEPPPDTPPPPQ